MTIASKYSKLTFNSTFILTTIFIDFLIYFYSGIDKLLHFDNFIVNIGRSPFAPSEFLTEIAVCIIMIEIGLSLLLFSKKFRKLSLFLLSCLSFIFSIYIILMITYSPNLPCSCGGIVNFLNWNEHLALTIYLTLSSIYATLIFDKA